MYFTTRMVTGRMITSYKDLSTACVPIMISNSLAGTNPAKAIGKKIRESALSPIRVDTIAREILSVGGDFHFAHHIGVQERTGQKRYQAGDRYTWGHPEDEIETFLTLPKRGGR